jgi:hypothetical protein
LRLPVSAHTSRPWRIHELTGDFQVEDVWSLPTPGGPDDFPRLATLMASGKPFRSSSPAARGLFAVRRTAGNLFGWDAPEAGLNGSAESLRDRLPADLREASKSDLRSAMFSSLYRLDDEWAGELANRTVHAVLHVGWVEDGAGGYLGQMAILTRPNGLSGAGYMAAIRPFRQLVIYPAAIREIGREWPTA